MRKRLYSTGKSCGRMYRHFAEIASGYSKLRATDIAPLMYIVSQLRDMSRIRLGDLGCGPGRYDDMIIEYLGQKCQFFCFDVNGEMLSQLRDHMKKNNIQNFIPIRCDAHRIPLQTNSLDCVVSFNAIHHFYLPRLLREVSRILKAGGKFFIYTRLKEQNEKTIWGLHFPFFSQKERRLYQLNTLEEIFQRDPNLKIDSMKYFEHQRLYTLERLINQAKNYHYSTFKFYSRDEFKEALRIFKKNLLQQYNDPAKITCKEENTLLVVENN